jgi:ParB/RepB/Spo0J family partition protein
MSAAAKKADTAAKTETQLVIPQATPEVQLVKLETIEVKPQVRTVFNDESLAELAEDIKAHGVIQPITVRLNRGKHVLVAGERRVRAATLAGLTFIPAIVAKMTEAEAETVQLAENIHREDLTTEDLAAAIKRLYEIHKKADTVAGIVKKSKAWVSKHLAIASGLGHSASSLLRDGFTDDMEVLLAVNKLQDMDYSACQKLCHNVRTGKAGRKEAREALKAAKEQEKAEKAAAEANTENGDNAEKQQKPITRTFNPRYAFNEIDGMVREGKTLEDAIATYTTDQQNSILDVCNGFHEAGTVAKHLSNSADQLRHLAHYVQSEGCESWPENLDLAAFIVGMTGQKWTLQNLLGEDYALTPSENQPGI